MTYMLPQRANTTDQSPKPTPHPNTAKVLLWNLLHHFAFYVVYNNVKSNENWAHARLRRNGPALFHPRQSLVYVPSVVCLVLYGFMSASKQHWQTWKRDRQYTRGKGVCTSPSQLASSLVFISYCTLVIISLPNCLNTLLRCSCWFCICIMAQQGTAKLLDGIKNSNIDACREFN